jgi:hypothetical protein
VIDMHVLKPMLISAVLLPLSSPVHAMNWEGHDDWMVDIEPARILSEDMPPAKGRPGSPCPPDPETHLSNPYEQIPIGQKGDCSHPAQRPKPDR